MPTDKYLREKGGPLRYEAARRREMALQKGRGGKVEVETARKRGSIIIRHVDQTKAKYLFRGIRAKQVILSLYFTV